MCPISGKPAVEYITLARAVASRKFFALGIILLGLTFISLNFYHDHKPFSKFGGSLWLVQLWLFAYFLELRSSAMPGKNLPIETKLFASMCSMDCEQVMSFFEGLKVRTKE